MSIIGTKKEFEALADYVLRDFLGNEYGVNFHPIDIMSFATEYLKMKVSYRTFNNKQIAGMRINDEILLDQELRKPNRRGEHNFTLAHECGHELINWQDENFSVETDQYRMNHTRKPLRTEDDFAEWQANVVAAYLLMPPFIIEWVMYTFRSGRSIEVFDNMYLYHADLTALKYIMEYLGVSKTALLIRLNDLGYIIHKPLSEFDNLCNIPMYRR